MLLGLVVLVAVLSVVDAGLRIYDHLVAASRERRPKRKELQAESDALNVC